MEFAHQTNPSDSDAGILSATSMWNLIMDEDFIELLGRILLLTGLGDSCECWLPIVANPAGHLTRPGSTSRTSRDPHIRVVQKQPSSCEQD